MNRWAIVSRPLRGRNRKTRIACVAGAEINNETDISLRRKPVSHGAVTLGQNQIALDGRIWYRRAIDGRPVWLAAFLWTRNEEVPHL